MSDAHDAVASAVGTAIDDLAPTLGVPGVAAAVVSAAGTTHHCHGSPVAGDPRTISADTLFQIGSVSKPLTALIVHTLIDRGQLDAHTDVGTVLERDDLPPATIAQLLSHQAGVDGDALLIAPPVGPDMRSAVDAVATGPRLGCVGGAPSYSNAAYTLLGAAIERVTGDTFAGALRSTITRPLRMRRTVTSADEAITHTVALPHQSHDGDADLIPGGVGWQPRWELRPYDAPPAGVISTASDLGALCRYLLGIDTPARAPLPAERLHPLWRAVAEIGPQEWTGGGLLVDGSRSATVAHHPGVTAGYCASLTLVPEAGLGVVVLTNATSGGRLADVATGAALDAAGITRGPRLSALADGSNVPPHLEGRYVGGLGITTVEGETAGRVVLTHEAHTDGRWQPFPDAPLVAQIGDGVLVGVENPEMVVPFGTDADGSTWIRWNRRLRVRTS